MDEKDWILGSIHRRVRHRPDDNHLRFPLLETLLWGFHGLLLELLQLCHQVFAFLRRIDIGKTLESLKADSVVLLILL
jgi:hypothetical protein